MADKEISIRGAGYRELFRLPDGGFISITEQNGDERIRQCKFIDAHHLYVGRECLHVDQLAEIVMRDGLVLQPAEPEIVSGYCITDRQNAGDKVFVLAHNPGAPQPWVTWQGRTDRPGYDLGHYYAKRGDASTDLFRRTDAERRGAPYEPAKPPKSRDRGLEP